MDWMQLADAAAAVIPSPALVLYPERIEKNLHHMVSMTGGPERLRPHLKTHKLPQILRRQLALGITKCKAATIAEAEMAAQAGVPDVLLSAQPVGPGIQRFLQLAAAFPATRFSALCDDEGVLSEIGRAAVASDTTVDLLLDLDVGQGRTGRDPRVGAAALYHAMRDTAGVRCAGLHAYDGHLHQPDPVEREAACTRAFKPVRALRDSLLAAGLSVPTVVAGGSPTFPFHAQNPEVECSPGTTVLWDAGYAAKLQDLEFLPSAALLTRVISKPGSNRLCLDLGHKAVASEMPHPRVIFPALPDAHPVAHNEEHLVLETAHAADWHVGSVLYGIPWHICPTVALHSEVYAATPAGPPERWPVAARSRRITI